mgnify:CR=1 FL=1|tara:strand:+ start:851 stop:2263 length:1413 start_codon:yes stop_codon:yes gene_type:complete
MPRVKTISPGRLTGISGLTREAARQVGRQKDVEYEFALQDWQAEKAKLEGIKQEQLNYLDQKMKMIAGEEQAGGATFDEGFKKAQMDQAKEYASIVSDIKLGNIDPGDGYAKLAVFDQSLKNIETAIPNINAFSKRIQDAINKEEGEVGSFIYDGSGRTGQVAQLFNDMYSPTKNGNVSTVIENGKTFLVHKDGQKISIEGLNAIMSGENPDYPINFVEDPREALQAVHDVMMKENESKFKIRKGTKVKNSKGETVTTTKDQYYLKKGSNYDSMLKEAVVPILDDDEKMKGFWLNLTKDNDNIEGGWNNGGEQRKIAQQALVDMARNSFGPKNDVLTVDVSLPKSDEDGDENDTLVDYTDLVGGLIEKSKVKGTNIPQPKVLRELAYDEIMSLNPGEFVRSSDTRVIKDVGIGIAKTKKLLGYDPLYTWNPQQGGFWEEFPISDENLSSTGLNKLLIEATPKSKKKKAYN